MVKILILLLLISVPVSAATYDIGISGHTYTTIAAMVAASHPANGDSVVIWGPGTWTQDWWSINKNDLKIVCRDSRGRTFDDSTSISTDMPIFDGNNDSDPIAQQGIWRTSGNINRCEVNGGEFINASNLVGPGKPNPPYHDCVSGTGPNAVPFRMQTGTTGLFWLHNCRFHDNDMNGEGSPESLLVEKCLMYHPNNSCGNQHNWYANVQASGGTGTGTKWLMVRYCQSYAPTTGQGFKSRADHSYFLYNRFYDGTSIAANLNIAMENGGNSFVVGNTFEQANATGKPNMNLSLIGFQTENTDNVAVSGDHCWVFNNTFVNLNPGAGIFIKTVFGTPTVTYKNNIFYGDGTLTSGPGTFTGSNNYTETGLNNNAKFLNPGNGDYHLTAASPSTVLDLAVSNGTNDGFNCTAANEYVLDLRSKVRTTSGSAGDYGPFEFVQSGGGGGGGGSDPCQPYMWREIP